MARKYEKVSISGTEDATLKIAKQVNPPRNLFGVEGHALAKFLQENVYSGTYDEMMKNLIKSEYDDYNNRSPKDDPEAAQVAAALAVIHRRLCERCEMAAKGPEGVD